MMISNIDFAEPKPPHSVCKIIIGHLIVATDDLLF